VIATQIRLLPEVIDISIVPTAAGVGSLVMAAYGAARGFPMERVGKLTLLGTLGGGLLAVAALTGLLVVGVLS
jgi:hypothetical protein